MNDPLIDAETNIKGTIVLLEECVEAKIKKIIFASSGGAVYGNQDQDKFSEDDQTDPISPYAISKLAIEKYLEYFRRHRKLDYLILRYSNPYGPGQNVIGSQGIIPIFLNLVRQNKAVNIFGDGENIRDYVFIDDVIGITKKMFNKKTKHSIYNIGSGKGESINDVIDSMEKVAKKKINILKQPARDIDVRKIVLDVTRVSTEFGYEPKTSMQQGIKKTWDWLNKQ